MTTHHIAPLAGWYQVIETDPDGTVTPIGSFRTETDARDWLRTYLRLRNEAAIFKVGFSEVRARAPAEAPTPVTASESD